MSLNLIQEKVISIFEDLKAKRGKSIPHETFNASHGYFFRFKKRANLQKVAVSEEAASADKKAADRYFEFLRDIIEKEGYSPKQIFNVNETGLFWKKNARKNLHQP